MNSKNKTKTIKPTIRGFLAWLKRQPKTASWDYCNPNECPFASYLKSRGVANPLVSVFFWRDKDSTDLSENQLPRTLARVLLNGIKAASGPSRFSSAKFPPSASNTTICPTT